MSDPTASAGPRAGSPAASDVVRQRLQAAVGDRYRIDRQIGEGGMATVFLAEDTRHGRKVAIKVLQETLAHTIGIRRFLQEIEVIARLQHPNLLTLIDSGDMSGMPYYVMPYVEALSLRELITKEKRLSVEEAVRIAHEVADALAFAHSNGVVHRDIKPSNILMSGGHAVVADFGIATALEKAGVGRLTETGISLGSPTYMSPEQASGERDLDERTDVYSLGCVLYELLCGEPPIDGMSMQHVVTKKLTGNFPAVRATRPDVPAALAEAVHKALSTERGDRFATMRAFDDAIVATSGKQPKRASRRVVATRVAIAAAALIAVGLWIRSERRELWAAQQLSEINRLVAGGAFAAAYHVAEGAGGALSGDTTLQRLKPVFVDFFRIVTSPPGARVYRKRLDRPDRQWELWGTTPMDSVTLPKFGIDVDYAMRVEREGYQTVEMLPNVVAPWAVWRNIQPIDTLRLDPLGSADSTMVRIPGFQVRDTLHPGSGMLTLQDFYIDKREVTNAEFKRFVDAGGYSKREYWTEPFVREGRSVSWENAMSALRDRTGLPGPATWSGGTYPPGQESFPVGGVSWYEAAAYARFVGKHLPTSVHWFRAALRHHREAGWIYMPTSNLNATAPRQVGQGIMNAVGMFDVAGNVREWCANPIESGRLTRGAGWEDAEFYVGNLIPKPEFDRSPSNGFRLAKYDDADTTIAHATGPITRAQSRDYAKTVPASNAELNVYKGLYEYDAAPLEQRVDTQGVREQYRWEKVSFSSPVRGEPRMAAYVFLPKDGAGPFPAVLLWVGSNALSERSLAATIWPFENIFGFIPRSGRALVLPLLKGTFERDDSAFSIGGHPPAGSRLERDLTVLWNKEVRRTIDYLESRTDIRQGGVGFYGLSWGSSEAPITLAVEPRIKTAVLNVGGLRPVTKPLPEIDAVNYLQAVRSPVLMLNGRHDIVFPYETSQLPFFRLLGTPAADKKHFVYPAGHLLPQLDMVRETLAWYDKYLPVAPAESTKPSPP